MTTRPFLTWPTDPSCRLDDGSLVPSVAEERARREQGCAAWVAILSDKSVDELRTLLTQAERSLETLRASPLAGRKIEAIENQAAVIERLLEEAA
jgi:hypothetical protein